MDWRHQAACRDHDPELWFSGKPYEQAAALAICRSCPVIGECRRFADEHNRINGYQLQGIWGGRRYGVKWRPKKGPTMNNIDANVTAWQLGPVTIMRGTATPTTRVSHPECFGRFTVIALSPAEAIRKCLRRVARMCADCSAREQLDQQEARA